MKKANKLQKGNFLRKSGFRPLALGMVLVMVLALTACTSIEEENGNGTAARSGQQNSTQGTGNDSMHTVEPNPSPLAAEDMALSPEGYGAKGALADTELTISDMLLYAAQDEYLAHGEYAAIIEKFGSQTPYANIIESEESHLSALRELYAAYGMTFPEDTSAEHLIVPESLQEAAQTGVQAEIDNIAMYERFLTFDLPDSIRDVFEFLKTASQSHLSAFEKQVDKLS